jgi:hypothetical protein
MNYNHLKSIKLMVNTLWTIQNLLPIPLVLYKKSMAKGQMQRISVIDPRGTLKYPHNFFTDGDVLFTFYSDSMSHTLTPVLQPYLMRNTLRNIRLGTVEYSSTDGHLQTQASNWDMRGVWLHNKIGIPIDIFYKGNLVAQLHAYDGQNYLGGSRSSIYFDNDREGLDFMDSIEFRLSTPRFDFAKMFSINLTDIECQVIFIGTVSAGTKGPLPDFSVYRVDKPVLTGIPYYKPTGQYNSISTYSVI